jgi:ferric-dicitrate binding protein FerR (iron transport regulator)
VTLSLSELAARRLRRDVYVEQGEAEYTARRARLVRAATARPRLRGAARWLLLSLTAATATGAYTAALDRRTSFEAGDVGGRVGAYYVAPPTRPLPLRFADGSTITLAPGSRARVLTSALRRRAIVLERGSARAGLATRWGLGWVVSAGPFSVESAGGKLDLTWQQEAQTLTIVLAGGSAILRGPGLPAGRNLVDGQRFVAQAPRGSP